MKVLKVETPMWVGRFEHELCGAQVELDASDQHHILGTTKNERGAVVSVILHNCPHCGKVAAQLRRIPIMY